MEVRQPTEGSALIDPERLAAIAAADVADGAHVPALDRYTRLASQLLGVPVSLVSIVTATRQFFPSQTGLSEPWATARSTPLSHSFCQYVVADGELVVEDTATDERVSGNLAQTEMDVGSYAGVPIADGEGNVLGAFCAIDHAPHQWSERDLDILRDVAAGVTAEIALRSVTRALEEQLAREQMEREFEHGLLEAASAMNRAATFKATARALARHGSETVGASMLSLALVEGRELRFFHGPGVLPVVAEDWVSTPLDSEVPMAVAVAENTSIRLHDRRSFDAWPAFAEGAVQLGLASFLAVPIADSHGGVLGSIGVGWQQEADFDVLTPKITLLRSLATHALRRAARFEAEREHAQTLERVVLPTLLPTPRDLELSGDYLAPTGRQRVGGDLYDAVLRDDGMVGLIIADATGHDVGAARAVARVRHAVGVLTLEGHSPAQILSSVNRYLLRSSIGNLVTCVYALIDPEAGTATLANAGHLQPLLLSGSSVVEVGPSGQQLMGVGPFGYTEEVVELDPGATMVMFTDGLVERRDRTLSDGLAWLKECIGSATDRSAAALLRELFDTVSTTEREDDVAVLCARILPTHGDNETLPTRQWSWTTESLQLSEARGELAVWLRGQGWPVDDDPASLVVTELLTNARSASDPDEPILLRTTIDDRSDGRRVLIIEVENKGPKFKPGFEMPDALSERGRGLAMVSALVDSVEIDHAGRMVRVSATLVTPKA